MKSSREQFEEWIYKNRMRGVPFDIEVFDVDGEIFYKSTETQGQWNAWQASRAAIVIELPWLGQSSLMDTDDVVEAIELQGLTAKAKP